MGKIRTKLIGLEEVEQKQKKAAKVRREEKKKRTGKDQEVKEVLSDKSIKKEAPVDEAKKAPDKKSTAKKTKSPVKKTHGKRYQEAQKNIQKDHVYGLEEGLSILKKMPHARFDETVEVHINTKEKDLKGEVKFPHSTGKTLKIVVCDDDILAAIESGKIDFDVLIAHPSFVPKLVKFARVLGPRGLMPNPKNGTLTDKVDDAAKKFTSGSVRFKTEAKFPIIHQTIGKISFEQDKLMVNIQALIKTVQKSKIESVYLASTMSPSLKIDINSL